MQQRRGKGDSSDVPDADFCIIWPGACALLDSSFLQPCSPVCAWNGRSSCTNIHFFPPNGRQRVALGALHRCLFSCYPCVGKGIASTRRSAAAITPLRYPYRFLLLVLLCPTSAAHARTHDPRGRCEFLLCSSAPLLLLLLLLSRCALPLLLSFVELYQEQQQEERDFTRLYGYSITRYSITRMCPPASLVLSFFLAL